MNSKNKRLNLCDTSRGFTIVELLVVIVVIGILASLTVVAYTGISGRAVASALQSDLDNASKQLKLYQVDYGVFPAGLRDSDDCPTGPTVDPKYCLKHSSGNDFNGYSSTSSTFSLCSTNGTTKYCITNDSGPIATSFTLSDSGGGTWAYKRPITITNSSGEAQTDYQVQVSLTAAALGNPYTHINSDGSDIRFTNSTGTTEFPYWVESWSNTATSVIWVKVPSLPSGTNTNFLNMYYGNSSATSYSNGDNTFVFFDDFDGVGLDAAKWDTSGTGTLTVSGGWITVTVAGNTTKAITTKSSFPLTSLAVDQKINALSFSGNGDYSAYCSYLSGDAGCWYKNGDWNRYIILNGVGQWANAANTGMVTGDARMTIAKSNGTVRWVSSGSRVFDDSWSGTTDNNSKQLTIFSTNAASVKADFVFVRKYVYPEPTHTAPGTETAP